jgi:hypothetical protein
MGIMHKIHMNFWKILLFVCLPIAAIAVIVLFSITKIIVSNTACDTVFGVNCTITETRVPLDNETMGTGQTWRDLTVGLSNEQDVIKVLGEPDVVQEFQNGDLFKYYPPDTSSTRYPIPDYSIALINDLVVQIALPAKFSVFNREVFLSEFINEYGNPDFITWSRTRNRPQYIPYTRLLVEDELFPLNPANLPPGESGYRTVIFVDEGVLLRVAVSSSFHDSRVSYIVFYQPCSLPCVEAQFYDSFWASEPPPHTQTFRGGGGDMMPKDPWGLTNE